MGTVVELGGSGDDPAVVQWFFPGFSKEATGGGGRKRQVRDIFGLWQSADDQPVGDLMDWELPDSLVRPGQVLVWSFDLESSQIPFSVFDQLYNAHGVDCTGLSLSSTARGCQYRAHRLMSAIK